jgi:hypothetical protein
MVEHRGKLLRAYGQAWHSAPTQSEMKRFPVSYVDTRCSVRAVSMMLQIAGSRFASGSARALDASISMRHYAGHVAVRERYLASLAALALEPAAAPWLNASIDSLDKRAIGDSLMALLIFIP